MSAKVYNSLRWVASSKLIVQIVSWASTIVVMRLLAPADYGLVAMSGVFSGFLIFLGDFGLSTALISRRETDTTVLEAAFGLSLLGGLLLFVATFCAAPLVADFFSQPQLTSLVRVSGILFLTLAISTVPRAQLAIRMQFRSISYSTVVSSLATTCATLTLAWLGYGPWALVVGTVFGATVRAAHLQLQAGPFLRPSLNLNRLRGMLRLSGYLVAQNTAYYWYEQVDSLIVGRSLGDVSLGSLVAGKNLALTPVSKVAEVTNQVALPAFAHLQLEPRQAGTAYSTAVRLLAIISFPCMWGMAVTAPDLVPLLLGSKWHSAIIIVQVLSFGTPLRLAASVAGVGLQGVGRADLSFWYTLGALILTCLLLLVGVQWGLPGAAIAMSVSMTASFALGVLAISSCMPISRRKVLLDVLRAAAPAAVMATVVIYLRVNLDEVDTLVRLGACISAGIVTWAASSFAISPSHLIELRSTLRRIVKS